MNGRRHVLVAAYGGTLCFRGETQRVHYGTGLVCLSGVDVDWDASTFPLPDDQELPLYLRAAVMFSECSSMDGTSMLVPPPDVIPVFADFGVRGFRTFMSMTGDRFVVMLGGKKVVVTNYSLRDADLIKRTGNSPDGDSVLSDFLLDWLTL